MSLNSSRNSVLAASCNVNLKTIIESIASVKLPSASWKTNYDSKHTFLIFCTLNIKGEVKTSKSVVLTSPQHLEVIVNVLLNSKPIDVPYIGKTITNIEELSALLNKVENLKTCNNSTLKKGDCLLVAEEGGDLCSKCSNDGESEPTSSEEIEVDVTDDPQIVVSESPQKICRLCEEKVANLDTLLKHERKHLPNSHIFGFKCNVCNEFVDNIFEMVRHYYKYHDSVKFIKCLQCKLKFTNTNLLKKHLRHHRFICIKCNLSFTNRSLYKKHVCGSSQMKKTNYVCSTCKMKFSTSFLLKQHAKEHEIVNSYKCQYCMVDFKGENDYVAHKNDCKIRHLRYVCKICSERYSCASQRKIHMDAKHPNYCT